MPFCGEENQRLFTICQSTCELICHQACRNPIALLRVDRKICEADSCEVGTVGNLGQILK